MNSLFASSNTPSVLIVGAGPCGLSMAKALQTSGINPDIIEKAEFIRSDGGARIAIPANGSWALQKLGIPITLKARTIQHMQFTDDQGALLIQEEVSHIHPDGAQFCALTRNDLMQLLLSCLDDATHIQTGISVTHFSEETDKVTVTFSNNTTKTYDFVVGCDGIHSTLRKMAHPEEAPEFLGLFVWRTTMDALQELTMPVYMLGSDKSILLYPMPNNKLDVYGQIFQTVQQIPNDTFFETFASFGGLMPEVLKTVDAKKFHTDHMEKSHSVRFRLDGYSRILLAGDAAHAFGTMLQNGAAQAFEDAYVIQELFAKGITKEQIPACIDAFIDRRQARVEHIYTQSNAKIKAISNPEQLQGRNETISKSGAPNVNSFKQFMKENP